MREKIVVLHGTNYWNMGDLGLMIAFLESLKREFDRPEITILSVFANLKRPAGQTFDVAELGAVEKPGLTLYPAKNRNRFYHNMIVLARAILMLSYMVIRRFLGIRITVLLPGGIVDSVNALYDADIIISKPVGFLYDCGESIIPAPHQLLTILAATLTGKPVVIYAQSIGPFNRPVFHGLVRFVLDRTRLVIVRDEPSLEECQKVLRLRQARIELTADEAFLLTGVDNEVGRERLNTIGVPPGVPLVGFTVLNWYFPSANEPELSKCRYIQAIARLIDYVNSHYGIHVVIFPFVLAGGYGHAQDDEKITEQVYRHVKRRGMAHVCRETDPRVIKSVQSEMEVFIGSRMHSNIFALSSCVPAIAISYLPKTDGIMAMLGLSDFVLDINTLQIADLQTLFDRLWQDRIRMREHLKGIIPEIQARARQNAQLTKDLLENSKGLKARTISARY